MNKQGMKEWVDMCLKKLVQIEGAVPKYLSNRVDHLLTQYQQAEVQAIGEDFASET